MALQAIEKGVRLVGKTQTPSLTLLELGEKIIFEDPQRVFNYISIDVEGVDFSQELAVFLEAMKFPGVISLELPDANPNQSAPVNVLSSNVYWILNRLGYSIDVVYSTNIFASNKNIFL